MVSNWETNEYLKAWKSSHLLSDKAVNCIIAVICEHILERCKWKVPSVSDMIPIADSIVYLFRGRLTRDVLIKKTMKQHANTVLEVEPAGCATSVGELEAEEEEICSAKRLEVTSSSCSSSSSTARSASTTSRWKGKLFAKFWNLSQARRNKMKKLGQPLSSKSFHHKSTATVPSIEEFDLKQIEADISFLRSATLLDKEGIKIVLARTHSYRRKEILQTTSNLKDFKFTFYYADPGLISYEFGLWFPGKEFMFVSKKQSLEKAINVVYSYRGFSEPDIDSCPEEVKPWAKLLRMTMFRGKEKKSFPFVLKNLFSSYDSVTVSIKDIILNRQSNYPYIAISNGEKDSPSQYILYFEGDVIPLRTGSTFTHALDLQLKISWIFDYSYSNIMVPFFNAIERLL